MSSIPEIIDPDLTDGQHGPYRVRRGDGVFLITTPKPFVPSIKAIGARWDYLEGAFKLGFAEVDQLRDLIERGKESEIRARALPWPTIPGLAVTVRDDGCVAVKTPYSESIKQAIKSVPTARWDRQARVWVIRPRYRLALRKALAAVSGEIQTVHEVEAEIDAQPLPSGESVEVTESHGRVRIVSPYDEKFVEACRRAGLRWDKARRVWSGEIPKGRRRSALANAIEAAIGRAAEAQARLAAEREMAPAEAPSDEAQPVTQLWPVEIAPAVGEVVNRLGRPMVVAAQGRTIRINGDHPSCMGEHLLGYEGSRGVYIHLREATPEEAARAPARDSRSEA